MLVLGASASRPREAYELRLSVARDGASGSGSEPPGRRAGADAARRATRVLVGALADAPDALNGSSHAQRCGQRLPRAHTAVCSSHEAVCASALPSRCRCAARVPPKTRLASGTTQVTLCSLFRTHRGRDILMLPFICSFLPEQRSRARCSSRLLLRLPLRRSSCRSCSCRQSSCQAALLLTPSGASTCFSSESTR